MILPPDLKQLFHSYPWLINAPDRHRDYLEPWYYDQLLHEYTFGGRTDLDLLRSFLDETSTRHAEASILELGSGTGRATDHILEAIPEPRLIDLVDLSPQMAAYCRTRYSTIPSTVVHEADSVDFLYSGDRQYHLVISLWNLSHSIHQHMLRHGRAAAEPRIREAITRLVCQRLIEGGSAFLIHYDIQSPEQQLINPWRLLLWADADPTYRATAQSPSKQVLDEVLGTLQQRRIAEVECTHHAGDPIQYESLETALEVFVNFHMEGVFNDHPRLPDIVTSLERGLATYRKDGGVAVAPGCFTYRISRV